MDGRLLTTGEPHLEAGESAPLVRYFDIRWDSVLDGPGVRCVVHLQGCHLACPWCHSPHGQPHDSPPLVLPFEGPNPPFLGRSESPAALFRRLSPQLELLRRIGGLTLSGGEPLDQVEASEALLRLCRVRQHHTTIETSADSSWDTIERLAPWVDVWLVGLRVVPTTVREERVPEPSTVRRNIGGLVRSGANVVVRIPLIPGYTDNPTSLELARRILDDEGVTRVELLPFNSAIGVYYRAMARPEPHFAPWDELSSLERAHRILKTSARAVTYATVHPH